MKEIIISIVNDYLNFYPEEKERLKLLINFLNTYDDNKIIDWNNFDGHIVSGGFIYAKKEKKFLVLYHKDLEMYLYPGGHINTDDFNLLFAAKREIAEETGLKGMEYLKISENELVPFDIDTHLIEANQRLNLPQHHHFDFRYLFTVDNITEINIDKIELENYKWIDIDELSDDQNYGKIVSKIRKILVKK